MGVTGYEAGMYRDISRGASALVRIANVLEKRAESRVEAAAQRAFDAYMQVRDSERGDEWAEVDTAMVALREALAAE